MAKLTSRITGVSQGLQTKVKSGNHHFIVDEPEEMGGKDGGPNPLSTLLGALAGCENIIANAVAKEINFDMQGIEFDIRGEFDNRGLKGEPNVRPYFEKVTIQAKVKTNEPEERIKELQEKTDLRCPLFTTLKAADVEMVTNWVKA